MEQGLGALLAVRGRLWERPCGGNWGAPAIGQHPGPSHPVRPPAEPATGVTPSKTSRSQPTTRNTNGCFQSLSSGVVWYTSTESWNRVQWLNRKLYLTLWPVVTWTAVLSGSSSGAILRQSTEHQQLEASGLWCRMTAITCTGQMEEKEVQIPHGAPTQGFLRCVSRISHLFFPQGDGR